MLHDPGKSGARTVRHMAHGAYLISPPLFITGSNSPIFLVSCGKILSPSPHFPTVPKKKPYYSQDSSNMIFEPQSMLFEPQSILSKGTYEKATQSPAIIQSSSSPTSPMSPESDAHCPLRKRSRVVADVDSDNSGTRQRKKRRLRRDLITSRLSRPYASPSTHIVSRNAVKLGVWTGRRHIGRNVYRKAAILNSIRRDRGNAFAEERIESPKAMPLRAIHEPVNPDIHAIEKTLGPGITTDKLPPEQEAGVLRPATSSVATNYDIFDDEDSDPDEGGIPVNTLEESDSEDDGSGSEDDESDQLFPLSYSSIKHTDDPSVKDDGTLDLACQQSRSLMGG